MDEAFKTLLTILGTAGGSAFVLYITKGIGSWLSGAAHREQVKNTSLAKRVIDADTGRREAEAERDTKVDKAESDRDAADERRRQAEEHVAMLKAQIRELGKVPIERP